MVGAGADAPGQQVTVKAPFPARPVLGRLHAGQGAGHTGQHIGRCGLSRLQVLVAQHRHGDGLGRQPLGGWGARDHVCA